MRNNINTKIIKELLNNSTAQLNPTILEKLRDARTRALEQQRTQQYNVPVLAWLGHHGSWNNPFQHFSKPVSLFIAAIFMALLISGASYLSNYSAEHDIYDVDFAILTDEMPLQAYLD